MGGDGFGSKIKNAFLRFAQRYLCYVSAVEPIVFRLLSEVLLTVRRAVGAA